MILQHPIDDNMRNHPQCLCSPRPLVQYGKKAAGIGRGLHMNELIDRLVSKTGVERPAAERAVGIILDFLLKEGPTEKVQGLVDQMPGATQLVANEQSGGGGGFFGGMGGIMGAANRLMAAGLSMGQVQSVTREVVAYARETAGEDTVGEIVGSVPGLSQFV
jgi:hypothetical protein